MAIASAGVAANAQDDAAAGFSLQEVERLYLDDVEAGVDGQRVVELYLRALTRHGDPIDDLRPTHIDIRDNGERVDPEDVTVKHLGKSRRGVTWVIAMDASRTMKGETFDRAKLAAVELLDRIGHHDRVAVVTFAQTVEVVAQFEDTPVDVRTRLEELDVDPAGFKTLLYDGVFEALDLIRKAQNRPRRAAVIVFSDGKDSGSEHDQQQVTELANDSRVLVYTIGYGRFGGGGLEILAELARDTGADFQKVTSAADLQPFFNDVWDLLTRSYVVRYPFAMDGETHTIEVAIDDQSDATKLKYPDISGPVWPWLAGGGGVLVILMLPLLALRMRSAGRLVFIDGPRKGEVYAMRRGRTRIGAIEANDLVIPSMTVSRYHAEIFARGGKIELKDLHSENGTSINGNRVESAPLPVRAGDRIQIADIELVYEQ